MLRCCVWRSFERGDRSAAGSSAGWRFCSAPSAVTVSPVTARMRSGFGVPLAVRPSGACGRARECEQAWLFASIFDPGCKSAKGLGFARTRHPNAQYRSSKRGRSSFEAALCLRPPHARRGVRLHEQPLAISRWTIPQDYAPVCQRRSKSGSNRIPLSASAPASLDLLRLPPCRLVTSPFRRQGSAAGCSSGPAQPRREAIGRPQNSIRPWLPATAPSTVSAARNKRM